MERDPLAGARTSQSPRGSSESVDEDSPVRASGNPDRPSFTFIDHNDNLQSKRIRDANARKAIRSHVMRDVRRRERLSGVKRPTKKGEKTDPSPTTPSIVGSLPSRNASLRRSSIVTAIKEEEPTRGEQLSSSDSVSEESVSPIHFQAPNSRGQGQLIRWSEAGQEKFPPILSTVSLGLVDPFRTLPGDPPRRVGAMIQHCAEVFIPMTFPIENKDPQQSRLRIAPVIQSAIAHHTVFYAYMTFSSAHRALLAGQHSDLTLPSRSVDRYLTDQDHIFVKAKTIALLNEMMRNTEQAISDRAFEAVSMLLGTTSMVGNFEEGRMHARGLAKMAQLRGGVTSETFKGNPRIMFAILISDVKSACGTLSKPHFPIPWAIEPLSEDLMRKCSPLPGSPLLHLASGFSQIPILSPTIVAHLYVFRDLAYISDWNSRDEHGLSTAEHELFRIKAHETEHQLLSYTYEVVSAQQSQGKVIAMPDLFHPLELIARTAALLWIYNVITVSIPASGILRSLIFRYKTQLQGLFLQLRTNAQMQRKLPPPEALDLLAWGLFLGAESSFGQIERPWFVRRLAQLARSRGWSSWAEVEGLMEQLLYVERVNGEHWREIWKESLMVQDDEGDEQC